MSDKNGENKKDILMKKRNSSLGNWLSENTPFSRQFLFGKVSLCAFFKEKKRENKKGRTYHRGSTGITSVFNGMYYVNFFYGCLQSTDRTFKHVMRKSQRNGNVCLWN